jgi:hypothetical protein
VAAFKILCKIKPTDGKRIELDLGKRGSSGIAKEKGGEKEETTAAATSSAGASVPALSPMYGASNMPEVEQTMRLISYQGD